MSEPTEKQTPRTDAACLWAYYPAAMGAEKIAAYIESAPREGALVYSDFARQLETELAAAEAQAAAMRSALERTATQLAIVRRFLPSHGSFGEEGISAFEATQSKINAALATNAGAELLDRLSKAEALAIQMTAEREHNAMEALAMRAERDRLRAENESLRKSLSPTTTEKPNQQ